MSFNKFAGGFVGLLIYTLLIAQLTHALTSPVVVTEYIEVEVPVIVYEQTANEIPKEDKEWLRNIPLSEELQEYTWNLANEYGLSYDLVIAVMKQESNFNPNLISKTKDYGLTQVNKVNHNRLKQELKITDFLDPKQNIQAGVFILNECRNYWMNKGITSQEELFERMLLSFNRGINGSNKYIVSRGTHRSDYVKKVLNYKIQLETEGGI